MEKQAYQGWRQRGGHGPPSGKAGPPVGENFQFRRGVLFVGYTYVITSILSCPDNMLGFVNKNCGFFNKESKFSLQNGKFFRFSF